MVNTEIYLGSGTSVTFVPEIDIYLKPHQTAGTALDTDQTTLTLHADFTNAFSLVTDLYVGCILEFYPAGTHTTTHRVTSNIENKLTFHPAIAATVTIVPANDYFYLRGYGAPCPAPTDTAKRLNSDNWLGLVESLTFPTTEVEFKEQNLFVGGSRNFTHQYKGIETAGGASLNFVANHASWLYYFLGKATITHSSTDPDYTTSGTSVVTNGSAIITSIDSTSELATGMTITTLFPTGTTILTVDSATQVTMSANADGSTTTGAVVFTITESSAGQSGYYIEEDSSSVVTAATTGPLYYRAITKGTGDTQEQVFCPPILKGQDDIALMQKLVEPTVVAGAITNPIVYTFTEQEGSELPSFALEQNYSKLEGATPYRTDSTSAIAESLNFTLIATGNRVNSLSITANEKEEVKMTVETMARKVHSLAKNESYDARRGVSDNRTFSNFSGVDTFLEPFFFSSGSISIFGQNFLRITALSLKMENTLTEKRYVGIGSKSIQDHIPAQRTYELTFSAMITDDALYAELLNASESSTDGSVIDIIFDKANGEQMRLKFNDYYLTTNTWPIPEDKGAVIVEGTIKARTLTSCTVKTHWVLQG